MKQSELISEVDLIIRRRVEAGEIVAAGWLTMAILTEHVSIEGDDVDWYTFCADQHVRATIRQVLRGYAPDPEQEKQLPLGFTLNGFSRVRKAYLCTRDGEVVIVPTNQLTTDEVHEKEDEYRRMGMGCFEHADELARYRQIRFAA